MNAAPAPVDRLLRWATPAGAALRLRLLTHLGRGSPLSALAPDHDLCGLDLRGTHLAGVDLSRADLAHARLDGADLSRARLDGAILRATSALHTKLDGASLLGADLSIANCAHATLRRAILTGARLDGAVFMAADLSGADLHGATYAGCDFEDAWLIGVRRDRTSPPPRGSTAAYAAEMGFPTFVEASRRYLGLLHRPLPETLWIVETSVAVSPEPDVEVLALLRTHNWRTALIGAAAMLTGATSPAILAAAWAALDGGTWIAPQLAAALLLTDPAFEAQARSRLLHAMLRPAPAARPAGTGAVYRRPPAPPPTEAPRWKPTKGLASLAAMYRRLPHADREILDPLDALEQARNLDCESALALAGKWLSHAVENTPAHLRARWACLPGALLAPPG